MPIVGSDEWASHIFLMLVLVAVGSKVVDGRQRFEKWSRRFALLAFIGTLGRHEWEQRATGPWASSGVVIDALVIAGLTLGVFRIALPALSFTYELLVEKPRRTLRRAIDATRRRRRSVRASRDGERQAKRAHERWLMEAPQREQKHQQALHRAQQESDAQRRREDARAAALLSYSFYSAKLGDRFSREMFDRYVTTYMSDTHPPDVVERRSNELLAIFERHLADVAPPRAELTLEGLTAWYESTKVQIDRSSMDDRTKRTQLAELYARYTELMSELMERMRP